MTSTQVLPGRRTGTRDATALAGPLPRYVTSKAGFEPAFPMARSIRNLHHQRSLSREMRQSKIEKQILSRRSQRRAAIANPSWFALPSVSGLRLVPSDRPRASGARIPARAPGSGSPAPASAGGISKDHAPENKIPSGAAGSEGPVSGFVDFA